MKKYKMSKVFVPGGFPELTYYPRNEYKLESRLKEAKENLCKLIMVTGLTKSGKTVLTNNVFSRSEAIWFDGGAFTNEQDFWENICEQLDLFTSITENETREESAGIDGGLESEGGIPFLRAKASIKSTLGERTENSQSKTRVVNYKTKAIFALRNIKVPLIIDDFHYIPREKQGSLVRALKSLIFEGLPIIFIAIPHRRLDAIRVEREMTGRIEIIEIPVWQETELSAIPEIGFKLLNIEISKEIIANFAKESLGSPHLMQEFCRELCKTLEIVETSCKTIKYDDTSILPSIFKKVAQNTGRQMFEKLSRGPRQRTDRIKRKLKNGKTPDIYGVVLYALADMKPGIESIDYEELRSHVRVIMEDNIPQAHEVSRVLEHMARIAANDESSTPVIDWDKDDKKLHITDPFFAYYLRWGIDNK